MRRKTYWCSVPRTLVPVKKPWATIRGMPVVTVTVTAGSGILKLSMNG
nr:MAG TPA: hypothetical protein [Caudoviricetes sp.]